MGLDTSSTKLAASTSVTLDHLFSVSEVFQVEDQLEYEDLWSDTTESELTLPDSSKEIVVAHSKPTKNDEVIQQELQRILLKHNDDTIKIWGNSEKWVLELRDGRRVVVSIQIPLSPGSVIDSDEKE